MTAKIMCRYWLNFMRPRFWSGECEVTEKSIRISKGQGRDTPDYKMRFTQDEMRFFRETEPEARAVFVEYLRGLAAGELAAADRHMENAAILQGHAQKLNEGPLEESDR